jgi:hypothetical protein
MNVQPLLQVVSINGNNFDETLGIVSGALPPPNYKDSETIAHLHEVMPGLCDWSGFERCVAIGQFDSMGEATVLHSELNSIPDGRLVEVRLVEDYKCGTFKMMPLWNLFAPSAATPIFLSQKDAITTSTPGLTGKPYHRGTMPFLQTPTSPF